MPDVPVVFVISGPMAAGKSTVAKALAERFDRGVHLEGDVFRRSIVSGRREVTPDADDEALRQLELRYRLAAAATDGYSDAGYTVVVEDVIGPSYLGAFRTAIRNRPCHVIVLMPSVEAVEEREGGRPNAGYWSWQIDELHAMFAAGPRVGLWLDTSDMTAEQTVDAILAATLSQREPIVVTDYDPSWPESFERLAAPISDAVRDLGGRVEHVGSTSVPGLAAKPIIDIDVVVPNVDVVPQAIEQLRLLGYTYQGDKGIPGREAFLWPPGMPHHHVYVVVDGNAQYRQHIRFRDHLRSHPSVADDYAALKRELAEHHRWDRLGYTDAKTDFITRVLDANTGTGA